MSNDPLDVVFVTGDEAAALKRADTARKLAAYLERMPVELRGMFAEEFQHINRAELAQLRADLTAARDEIVSLSYEVGEKDKRIAQQAAQLEQARKRIDDLKDVIDGVIVTAAYTAGLFTITPRMYDELQMSLDDAGWLSANAQPQEQSA